MIQKKAKLKKIFYVNQRSRSESLSKNILSAKYVIKQMDTIK